MKVRTETLTIRLDPELRARLEAVRLQMPYKPNITTVVERGLQLALAELELMTSESEGLVRLSVVRSMADEKRLEAAE